MIYGTMENTLQVHYDMVLAHKKMWDYVWELKEFGIETPQGMIDNVNSLFKMSEKLRKALIADGIEVPHYDNIGEEDNEEDNEG